MRVLFFVLLQSPTTPPHTLAFFFFNDTATTEIYTLSLHDALPISPGGTKLGHLHQRGMQQFGLHQVVSQVAHQHAPGGEVSWSERNNDTRHMHISCQRACMHGATSTKSHHGELARITPLPYRDQFEQ